MRGKIRGERFLDENLGSKFGAQMGQILLQANFGEQDLKEQRFLRAKLGEHFCFRIRRANVFGSKLSEIKFGRKNLGSEFLWINIRRVHFRYL